MFRGIVLEITSFAQSTKHKFSVLLFCLMHMSFR